MDTLFINRLKTHLTRRLCQGDCVFTLNNYNYIETIAYVCEFVEQISNIELQADEKKDLVLSYYRRLIPTDTPRATLNYPSIDGAEFKTKSVTDISLIQHFADTIAPNMVDVVINATKGGYYINVNQKTQGVKDIAKKFGGNKSK